MEDSENSQQPSKKRAAVKELSRDNPGLDDEEDSSELEGGTFKRASDEVLASRRIVRVKRKEPAATTPSSNPFAGICLVPPGPTVNSSETNVSSVETKPTTAEAIAEAFAEDEKTESEDVKSDATKETVGVKEEKKDAEAQSNKVADEETAATKVEDAVAEETEKAKDENDNQVGKGADRKNMDATREQLSVDTKDSSCVINETSQITADDNKGLVSDQSENEERKGNGSKNAEKNGHGGALSTFQQHSNSKNAFTGLAATGFSGSSFSFGSVSQVGSVISGSLFGQKAEQPSFSFGASNNGNSSHCGASGSSIVSKNEGSAFPPMQEVPVETGEENERVAFSADSALFEFLDGGWKERGKGELKVNISTAGTGKARLLMRARGNYRLILNASLYPEMKLTNMEKKGITFACVNSVSEGKDGLSTFALKFKDATFVEEFHAAVMKHKRSNQPAEASPLKTPDNSPKVVDV